MRKDIDSDFGNREKILKYLSNKYGHDKVALVCNFNYITPLVAIRNVGKVLGISYSITSKISSQFTFPTWEENIVNNPTIIEEYAEYNEMFEIASHLSGRVNTFGSHACGLVIARTSLDDYLGSNLNTGGEYVVNVDKRLCESLGLIKFDVLGVSNLEIVQEVVNDLGLDKNLLDVNNEEFVNDEETFKLICSGKTDAVFQLESLGMKDLCKRIQPLNIRQVSDILALYRPDAMGSLESYIANKNDSSNIQYWCDEVKPILSVTNGELIYQEQMLSIIRDIGGRTYGGADRFRKGVGKKDPEAVQKEAMLLREEIIENNFSVEIADTISEYLKSFGGYLFCLSHSMGYSVLTLQTAYLKAHYPLHFFKALLNQNKDDYGNINKYIIDAKDFNVEVSEPNISKSDNYFSVANGKILFGLSAIKGVGEKVATVLLEERSISKFANFQDLLNRVKLNKKQVVNLIKSGAIPCKDKKVLLNAYGKSLYEKKEYKPVSTFTMNLQKAYETYGTDFKPMNKEDRLAKLNGFKKIAFDKEQEVKYYDNIKDFQAKYMADEKFWEFETLSIFLHDNPFVEAFKHLPPIDEVEDGESFVTVGIISNIQKKKDRNKRDYGYISLYSSNGLMEITCWSSQYKTYQDLIKKGSQVAILGTKREENYQVKEIKTYQKWLGDNNLEHLI